MIGLIDLFIVISTVGLVLLLLYNRMIQSSFILERSNTLLFSSYLLSTAEMIIIIYAFKNYDIKDFLGLKSPASSSLKTGGILNHLRHPLYLGTILITVALWLFIPNYTTLVTAICIFVYLPIGVWFEEKKLIRELGEGIYRL